MNSQLKNRILPLLIMAILGGGFIYMVVAPEKSYSESERRVLNKKPELTWESISDTSYMGDFEKYALDRIFCRDALRSVKAAFCKDILLKMDTNGYYMVDGYVSKLEYPLSTDMLDYATDRFYQIYNKDLKKYNIKPYFMIVPDKNCYMAEAHGYLSVDYDELYNYVYDKTEYMEHIDIRDLLTISDYYRTDTHWRQECLVPVAERVGEALGINTENEYKVNTLDKPFYGVYAGQSAYFLKPETIKYLTSDTLNKCRVTSYNTGIGKEASVYNMDKANGRDSYEMFLEGADALITIENPDAVEERELVIFRDSFASSFVPLLVNGYSKITLVDIRYIQSDYVSNLVDYSNADVLFMYSTLILNNSLALK